MKMPVQRRRRLTMAVFCLCLFGVVIALVLYALRQNISLFYSPSQLLTQSIPGHRLIRVGGMVKRDSFVRKNHSLTVHFDITDYANTIHVVYHGVLPDLFREGQGVVVRGRLVKPNQVLANDVLAKHDENYMPPEVRSTLKVTT